jgi:hypothetical protein
LIEKSHEIEIDISLSNVPSSLVIENEEEFLRKLLKRLYPDTFRGHKGKRLQLALIFFKEWKKKEGGSSHADKCKEMIWSPSSTGSISNYSRDLSELRYLHEVENKLKFDPRFFLKLYGDIICSMKELESQLQAVKKLIWDNDIVYEPTENAPFQFSNTGEVIIAFSKLESKIRDGDELYLKLVRGGTWASEGIGALLRDWLRKLVSEKHIKLGVIASNEMPKSYPWLVEFLESLGQVIIDPEFIDVDRRWLFVGNYVIEVQKVGGLITPPEGLSGIVRKADDLEMKVVRAKFQELKRKKTKS